MFRTLSLSIISSLALYTQQYMQVMLTACEQAISKPECIAVCTVLNC